MAEIRRSPDIRRYGRYHRDLWKTYLVHNDFGRAMEDALWDSQAEGFGHVINTNVLYPRCREIVRRENYLPSITLVKAHFKTMRIPGVAKVVFLGGTKGHRMTVDLDGEIIEGSRRTIIPEHDDVEEQTVVYTYRIVEGTNVVPVPNGLIRIETAFDTFNPARILEKVGKVNSHDMTKLGLPRGTLMLLPPDANTLWEEDAIWYVNYLFAYDPKGHWNRLKVQKTEQIAVEVPVYNADNSLVTDGPKRFALSEVPVGDPEGRLVFEQTSFDDLDGWIRW